EAMPDMGAEGMGAEGGMDVMGMGDEDEGPKDIEDVGHVYELKKVYARLIAIESFLATVSDETLLQIRNYVSQAMELFKTLIHNSDLYKEQLDDILVTFYKFIIEVHELVQKYYKAEYNKSKKGA
ncbi:hypothetical protein KAR91_29185, partial [Candidatus Pacearchaeota archaeon]|nr:hypothetical protein [Candidatus Pacearchaeota archaeon]